MFLSGCTATQWEISRLRDHVNRIRKMADRDDPSIRVLILFRDDDEPSPILSSLTDANMRFRATARAVLVVVTEEEVSLSYYTKHLSYQLVPEVWLAQGHYSASSSEILERYFLGYLRFNDYLAVADLNLATIDMGESPALITKHCSMTEEEFNQWIKLDQRNNASE